MDGLTTLGDASRGVLERLMAADPEDRVSPCERAYRRGVHRAAIDAVQAIRDGASLAQMDEWADRVRAWREWRTGEHEPPRPLL